MITREIEVNKTIKFWLTIDNYRENAPNGMLVDTEKYVCYLRDKQFSAHEGELLKNEDGTIRLFHTTEKAIQYAIEFLTYKINH